MTPASGTGAGTVERGPRQVRSDILRLWHGGDRDGAETALAGLSGSGEWRLMLAAARFIRAHEVDAAAAPPPVPPREWPFLVNALIDFGAIAAARAALAVRSGDSKPQVGAADIGALLREAPPTPAGQAEQEFSDDPMADVQVVKREGATTILFAFAGGAHRFGGPLRLVHQWFRQLHAHVVYLRDIDGMFYAGGIRSLGPTRRDAVAGLAAIASDLGAPRVLCTGNSSGSFGAMRYGLDLAAEGVLCFAGPSRIDDSLRRVLERQGLHRAGAAPIDIADLDLAPAYAAADVRPMVRILFSGGNEADRAEAGNMAGLTGVELVALPDETAHGILALLVEAGRLDANLAWLMSATAVSGVASPTRRPWWRRPPSRR